MLKIKGAGLVSLAALEPRGVSVDILAIFLPLELKVVSCGFNSKGCGCSSCYRLAIRLSSDLRGINCMEENSTEKKDYLSLVGVGKFSSNIVVHKVPIVKTEREGE